MKFQTKAPLSVGYKAVLVHEFARPPKFALRLKFSNESQLASCFWILPLYTLISDLVEKLVLGLFLLSLLMSDHLIFVYLCWALLVLLRNFTLFYLSLFALNSLHEKTLTLSLLSLLPLLERFYVSFCWAFCDLTLIFT